MRDPVQQSFQSWAEDFHFSDDLKELESAVKIHQLEEVQVQEVQVQKEIPQAKPQPVAETVKKPAIPTEAVQKPGPARQFPTPRPVPPQTKAALKNDLLRDNHLMAKQIERLLDEVRQLRNENQQLVRELDAREVELSRYNRLGGGIYVRQ